MFYDMSSLHGSWPVSVIWPVMLFMLLDVLSGLRNDGSDLVTGHLIRYKVLLDYMVPVAHFERPENA